MVGGAGNDSYHVLSSGDKVVEASGGGTDTVLSALPAYTLGAEIENGRINTSAASNLNGNALNNVLWAGAGNNVLSGGAGIDTADYGASFSAVNLHLGITTAQATGGSGSDTLLGIENLSGSAYNDRLTGNGGANVLNGGSGNDTMEGGAGNDLYVVDTVADMLFERGDGGVDSVSSSVSYTLPTSVEKLTLTGSGTINGNGNGASNTISGNGMANVLAGIDGNDALRGMAGNDSLSGGNGNDLLDGGAGNDTLNGSAGLDTFRFSSALSGSSNVDRIAGFIGADDTLQLENSVFMKLTTTGVLSASFFRASTSGNAVDSNDFVLYDTDSGQLYYDADGIGTGAKVLVATLTATPSGMPVLTSADIFVT
jgi:Ca2+-binding RTX toxin-like protein